MNNLGATGRLTLTHLDPGPADPSRGPAGAGGGPRYRPRPVRARADDLVLPFLAVGALQEHGRAEGDPLAVARGLDDLGRADLHLQLADAALDEALAPFGGVVLGVLGEIAGGPRLRARLHD